MIPVLIFIISSLLFILNYFSRRTKNKSHIQYGFEPDIPIPITINELAEKYKHQKERVKGGSLCFWGLWFGRPGDVFHQISYLVYNETNEKLTIGFTEGEILIVNKPRDITESKYKLIINSADKVFWQWHPYGQNHITDNLHYYDLLRNDSSVTASTNSKYLSSKLKDLSITKPAVMLGN